MQDPAQYPQQPGYAPPAPAAAPAPPGGGNRGRTIAIIAIVLALVLAVLGVLRYNGPVDTVKGVYNDLFINFNVQAAANRFCSDSPEKITDVAATQKQFDQLKGTAKFDLAGVTYSMTSMDFISKATVHTDGTAKFTFTVSGQTQSTSLPLKADVKLKSSGLGWCIDTGSSDFTSPTGG